MAPRTTVKVKHRLFSVEDYYRMAEVGILREDDRVELLEGEVVEMAPIGSVHASVVKTLNSLLSRLLTNEQAVISVQDPVRLNDTSEPQPDIMLLRPRTDFYSSGHPSPSDVLLLIEVSDTSLPYDRDVKLPLYAQAGISEVWIVDLQAQTVLVSRDPKNGLFATQSIASRGDTLSSQALPHFKLAVDEILGTRQAST